MARKRQPRSLTRRQHRVIGLCVSAFVLFIVATGLALNHANGLRLDQRSVTSPGLLEWYGIDAPDEVVSFAVHPQWLSFAGGRWYLDGAPVASAASGVGAVAAGDWLLAAGTDSVLIVTRGGELIERMAWDTGTLGAIKGIGKSPDGAVVISTAEALWRADSELLGWTAMVGPGSDLRWSRPSNVPEEIAAKLAAAHRGEAMTAERVLLDLHSGRFFGTWGVILYDLFALALASLAVSGLLLWFRGRNGHHPGRGRRADRPRPGQTRR